MPTDPASVDQAVVREAGPDEWPEIADLTTEVYAALAPSSPPPSWTSYLGSIAATLTQPDEARRLVVDAGGWIAASVLLCPPSPGPAGRGTNPYPELRLLAVRAACRNSGLGGRLIEACEQRARSDGYEAITLHTTSLMPTAKAMYERRGYLRAPELDFEPEPGFVVWGYRRTLG
jgi:GNAT superfamily N-acetyltransferase